MVNAEKVQVWKCAACEEWFSDEDMAEMCCTNFIAVPVRLHQRGALGRKIRDDFIAEETGISGAKND